MGKMLKDGEERVMKPNSYLNDLEKKQIKVVAHRVDAETPYVVLHLMLDQYPAEYVELFLSDVLAKDVSERIQRALDILPSSK